MANSTLWNLHSQTRPSRLKQKYSRCADKYDQITGWLWFASNWLERSDIDGVKTYVEAAQDDIPEAKKFIRRLQTFDDHQEMLQEATLDLFDLLRSLKRVCKYFED